MFGGLISNTIGIVSDVTKIVAAPVAIAVDVTRAATKPIADGIEEVVKDTHEALKDENSPK